MAATVQFDRWIDFEQAVGLETTALALRRRAAVPFFRGHASTSFELRPSLLRPHHGRWFTPRDEQDFFYEFKSRGGVAVGPDPDSWDLLFLMRHHGVPTRLLDWSESFAAALFFALQQGDPGSDVELWLLDPYAFNQESCGIDDVLDVRADLKHSYLDYFIEHRARPEWRHAVAIYPQRSAPRLSSQLATFTLHASARPLEELAPAGLSRFTLSAAARPDAERYLEMAGINDFSLFPDLDGLARLMQRRLPPRGENEWPT
jgi:hypothetical protein